MAVLKVIGHALHKAEMEYHEKIGHTLGRIQHIALMSRIGICCATCCLATQRVEPTLTGLQGIKRCVKYLASHPHKSILFPSNYHDGSNVIRITWSGNQVKDHTTQIFLECHQDADHARIINRRRSVSGIIHTLLGVSVCWKIHIQLDIASESTDGEIRCMYKDVNKTKVIWIYIEALAVHTGAPTVHWKEKISCISVVEAKIVTPRVKHIDITVCFLQEQFDNGLFIPKCENSSVMPADMCTKPCSGPIIIWRTK